jgi:hypothetical protein
VSDRPIPEELLIQSTGPLVTAVVGTLVIGLLAQRITRRTQTRREELALRQQLVSELVEVAGSAAVALRLFERVTEDYKSGERSPDERLTKACDTIEADHYGSRVRGWVLERRLGIYFDVGNIDGRKSPWHKTLDALHLLFLIETGRLRSEENVSDMLEHIGLKSKAEDLDVILKEVSSEILRRKYSEYLEKTIQLVLTARILIP